MPYSLQDKIYRKLHENLVPYPGRFLAPAGYLKKGCIGGYVGWIGHGNVGDEILYECILQLFPSIDWTTAQMRPLERKIHKVITGRKYFWDVVGLGGGTLFNREIYLDTFNKAAAQANVALIFGTGVEDPSFQMNNVTVEQKHQLLTRWCDVMRTLPFVGVRGPHTKRILAEHGYDQAVIVGDPALLFSQPRAAWTPRKHITINIGCHDEMWGTPESIYTNVLQASQLLIKQGYELLFLPMHHIDVAYARRLQNEPGMATMVIEENYLDKNKVTAAFNSTDLVLGQRLHSVVLAHACGVPAIPLAYRPKCYDYLASVKQEHMALRTDQLDPHVMVQKVEQLIANYDQNVADLNTAVEHIRTSLRASALKVNALIEQACAS